MRSSKIRVFFYPFFSIVIIILLAAIANAADADTPKPSEIKPAVNDEQLYRETLDEVVERNRVQQLNFKPFGCAPDYTVTGELADPEKKAGIFDKKR